MESDNFGFLACWQNMSMLRAPEYCTYLESLGVIVGGSNQRRDDNICEYTFFFSLLALISFREM